MWAICCLETARANAYKVCAYVFYAQLVLLFIVRTARWLLFSSEISVVLLLWLRHLLVTLLTAIVFNWYWAKFFIPSGKFQTCQILSMYFVLNVFLSLLIKKQMNVAFSDYFYYTSCTDQCELHFLLLWIAVPFTTVQHDSHKWFVDAHVLGIFKNMLCSEISKMCKLWISLLSLLLCLFFFTICHWY